MCEKCLSDTLCETDGVIVLFMVCFVIYMCTLLVVNSFVNLKNY